MIPSLPLGVGLFTIRCALDDELLVYAPQPDPNDRSRLTIEYQINGRKGMLDGWLKDNDGVQFWPRDGEVQWVQAGSQGFQLWTAVWQPPGTKLVAPATTAPD